jgi:hypothetical protein
VKRVAIWLRTRTEPLWGLSVLVTLATAPANWPDAARIFVVALWILLALRLRDDVASAPRDRLTHPERITCDPAASRPMNAIAFSMLGGAALWLAMTGQAWGVAGLVGLVAVLEAIYALRGLEPGPLDLTLMMAKYPGLALVLATAPQWTLAALLGLGVVRFEVADDAGLAPRRLTADVAVAVEVLLLVILLPVIWAAGLGLTALLVHRHPAAASRAILVVTGAEMLAITHV